MEYAVLYLQEKTGQSAQWKIEHFDTQKEAAETAKDIAEVSINTRVYLGSFTVSKIIKEDL